MEAKINVKEDPGYKYLDFIITVGNRFSEYHSQLSQRLKDYIRILETGTDWGETIKKEHRLILLGGVKNDLGLANSIYKLLTMMKEKLAAGVDESDYMILDNFTSAFLNCAKENGERIDNVVQGMIKVLDGVELRDRLFINCCFIKKLEHYVGSITYQELKDDMRELAEDYRGYMERIENSLEEAVSYIPEEKEDEAGTMLFKARSLLRSSMGINNIFSEFFKDEKISLLPRNFVELLKEWDNELEQQCTLVKKVVDEN